MKRFGFLLLIPIIGSISLDEAMTHDEKEQTGYNDLNSSQKRQLQSWIDTHYDAKHDLRGREQLYLSLNIDNGSKLELSDGTTYEIDPDDRLYSVYWVTPFPVRLDKSTSDAYPVRITNMNSGTSVKGKRISTRDLIEKEREKTLQQPQKDPNQPQPPHEKK